MLQTFWENFRHNLFKPLLLFFYMGFLVPILQVEFEFPHIIYQGLTIYLLVSIGWHGGEELAKLDNEVLTQALKFMGVGFVTNFVIGIIAYFLLRSLTKLRRVDAATVAGYYGSDSAGTFATCMGVLNGLIALGQTEFKPAAYMPVMLAVMEIPGCLVALYLVSRLRHGGMDALGHMPDEVGYDVNAVAPVAVEGNGHGRSHGRETDLIEEGHKNGLAAKPPGLFSRALLHEVFLNPGLYLLFGGILIGYISQKQGTNVTKDDDILFLGAVPGPPLPLPPGDGDDGLPQAEGLEAGRGPVYYTRDCDADPLRNVWDRGRARLQPDHSPGIDPGDVHPLLGAVWRSLLHRRPRRPATCDPRGQSNASPGGLTRFDLLVQRDGRHPDVYRNREGAQELLPGFLTTT